MKNLAFRRHTLSAVIFMFVFALTAAYAIPPVAILSPGDRRLSNGAVLDSSCEGSLPPQVAFHQFIADVETALALVSQQASRCSRLYGFGEVGSVPQILSRLRISCSNSLGARTVMSTRHLQPEGLLSWNSAAFQGNYEVAIATQELAPFWILSRRDRASSFFHEVLHFLPTNNREWHNQAFGSQGVYGSCSNSIFRDRVYFLQAACFPDTFAGRKYYSAAQRSSDNYTAGVDCPGLCQSALTESDPDVHERAFWMGDVRMYPAIPYRIGDAEVICSRIQGANRRYVAWQNYRKQNVRQWEELVYSFAGFSSAQREAIRSQISFFEIFEFGGLLNSEMRIQARAAAARRVLEKLARQDRALFQGLTLQLVELGRWLTPEESFPGQTPRQLRASFGQEQARLLSEFTLASQDSERVNLVPQVRGLLDRLHTGLTQLSDEEASFFMLLLGDETAP
jgi:hypothetical protein